jgi:hypothetical protein
MRFRQFFMRVIVILGVVFFVRHRLRQINHREHYEYERLDE